MDDSDSDDAAFQQQSYAPTTGCRKSEKDIWERLVAAVERGVANQHFLVQCAVIQESQESAISTASSHGSEQQLDHSPASGNGGGGGMAIDNAEQQQQQQSIRDSIVGGRTRSASVQQLVAGMREYQSFPPPLGPMAEHDDTSMDQRDMGGSHYRHSYTSSSGTGSLEVDDRNQSMLTMMSGTFRNSTEAASTSGTTAVPENRRDSLTRPRSYQGGAPIFRPISQHLPASADPDEMSAGKDDIPGKTRVNTDYRMQEVVLTDLATRLAEECCTCDNEAVLAFLLDSNVMGNMRLLELACDHNAANCAKLLYDRCHLRFTNDMMRHAVLSGHRDIAMFIASTELPEAFTAVDVEDMLITAISSLSWDLVTACRDICRMSKLKMVDIIKPYGKTLMSALIESALRSKSHADLESASRLLSFLSLHEVPLPVELSSPPDSKPTTRRRLELLRCFLETLVTFSDSVLTASWRGLPLSFCSTDFFFRNSTPLMLVQVDLGNNSLSSLPSALFDGSMTTLRTLNASQNNLLDLDNLLSADGDFSGSRLENLDLSYNQMVNFPIWLSQLPCLVKLNLSYCLKGDAEATVSMNSSNIVQISGQHSLRPPSRRIVAQQWAALHLEELRLAGNRLTELPHFVKALAFLQVLDISHNMLTSLSAVCTGCVRLVTLVASYNRFMDNSVDFEGDAEMLFTKFPKSWHYTLSEVDLSHNGLLLVPSQLCLAQSLTKLDLSYNDIGRIPASLQWSCARLTSLKLAHNQFGDDGFETFFDEVISGSKTKVSPFTNRRPKTQWQALHRVDKKNLSNSSTGMPDSQASSDTVIELPSDKLFSLVTLDLSGNQLVQVPISVCHIRSLVTLSLSDNCNLKELRQEMGFLTSLFWLHIENCDKLQKQVEPFVEEPTTLGRKPYLKVRELLNSLLAKLRQARPYYGLKLPILGPELSGKTQLVAALKAPNGKANMSKSVRRKKEYACDHTELYLNADGQTVPKSATDDATLDAGRQIALDAWDISDLDVLLVLRSALFQHRCLFLVTWNAKSGMEGLEAIREWLRNVQLLSSGAHAIVVGTHVDRSVSQELRASYKNHIGSLTKGVVPLCFVCTSHGTGMADLRKAIYYEAKLQCEKYNKVPRSYVTLHRRFTQPLRRDNPATALLANINEHGIVSHDDIMEVYNVTEDVRRDLLDEEEVLKVGNFLHNVGTFVHFHDLFKNLAQFYFTNVGWLVKTIIYFMNHHHLFVDAGILTTTGSQALFGDQIPNKVFFNAFIALLEKMRVIFSIGAGRRCRYLVTFALPKDKPAHEASAIHEADIYSVKRVKRLFSFNRVPPELWGVLVSQLQVKLENWCRGQYKEKGMHLAHTVIWAKGVVGFLPDSCFKVESVEGIMLRGSSIIFPGINVIVASMNGRFNVLALIMQHINALLDETFTNIRGSHLVDDNDARMCIVPCPACSLNYVVLCSAESVTAMATERGGSMLQTQPPHFLNLNECAGLLALGTTDICRNTGQTLAPEELVPDLMFCDLPPEMIIDKVDVQSGTLLDSGSFGTVYRCTLDGQDVAVKVYTTDSMLQQQQEMSTMRTSAGDLVRHSLRNTMPSDTVANQAYKSDLGEVGVPMLHSLEEAQSEASRLNRLVHPCIVKFLGASMHPPCIVLEYAPLGSLSKYVKDTVKKVSEVLAAGTELTQLVVPEFPNGVLGRQLTNQIAYQVALGLEHIHKHGMIYKDLKADNVLLFSDDVHRTPNVKLTDYGIAAEELPGIEVSSVTGTLGYQAPEVVLRGTLSGKVDVYSYAMFLYEMMEGNVPFYRERTDMKAPMQLNSLVICGMRPALTVKPSLVQMDSLMHRCWKQSPEERPSPADIIAAMETPAFSLQNRQLTSLSRSADFVHYFGTRQVHSMEERATLMESSRDFESTTVYNDSQGSLPDVMPHTGPALRFNVKSPAAGTGGSQTSSDLRTRESRTPSESLRSDQIDSLSYELLFVAFGEGSHRSFSLVDTSSDAVVGGPSTFPGPAVKCAVTIRSTLWIGTSAYGKDGSRVEVFTLRQPCQLHEQLRFSENSSVQCLVAIDFDTYNREQYISKIDQALSGETNPEDLSKPQNVSPAVAVVLAGLGDGSILVFFGSPPKDGFQIDNLSWSKKRVVVTDEHDVCPVHSLAVISNTEVWCAHGNEMSVLTVNPDTHTCTLSCHIAMQQNTLRPGLAITSLVAHNEHVWATLLNQNVLLKFSTEHHSLLGCIKLSEYGGEGTLPSQQLSTELPGELLLRNYRPQSLIHRASSTGSSEGHATTAGATRSSSVSFDRAVATQAGSIVSAREVPTEESAGDGSPLQSSWRSKQLQQAQRQVPILPDSISIIRPVHDTLWVGLEDGSIMILGSGKAAESTEPDRPPATGEDSASSCSRSSSLRNKPSLQGVEEESEEGDEEQAKQQHQAAELSTPTVQVRPPAAGLVSLDVRAMQQQNHALLGRMCLPEEDPFHDRPVRCMVLTPSNLVVTSTPKQRQALSTAPSESFSFSRQIAPLHVWDAWTEERWQHFYSVIRQLHVT
eukprot:scpid3137/ scgid6100/ Leucine-rich repeat serine/threonine-protein kinase 1